MEFGARSAGGKTRRPEERGNGTGRRGGFSQVKQKKKKTRKGLKGIDRAGLTIMSLAMS